jgi:nucleoside triphosphatase
VKGHFFFFDFACKTDSDDVILNDEAQSYIWVSIEEALEMPIDHYTRVAIQKYIEKQTDKLRS